MAHNISINITEAESPMCVRRRIHFRSLSDVTPASRAHTPRARSHSERPADAPSHSSLRLSPPAPAPALNPARRAHSERSSPNVSLVSVLLEHARSDTEDPPTTPRRARFRSDTVTILGNPWRKMSEADLKNGAKRTVVRSEGGGEARANDPWMKPKTPEIKKGGGNVNVFRGVSQEEVKREVPKRGKLERRSPVVCESCGNESCDCWRPRSPRCPRTPRLSEARSRRALSSPAQAEGGEVAAELQCTCEGAPRPSPARLSPRPPPPAPPPHTARSLSVEDRVRSLSQQLHRVVCSNDVHGEVKPADPLLETTC